MRGHESAGPEEDSKEESGVEFIVAFCYWRGCLGMSSH